MLENSANTTLSETDADIADKGAPLVWKLRLVYAGHKESLQGTAELLWQEFQPLHIGRQQGGNSSGAWLQLVDARVSREHARIFRDSTGIKVEDLNSRNGSELNGRRLAKGKPQPLSDGDVLRFGDSFLVLRHELERVSDVKIDSLLGISRAACLLRCAIARSAVRERTMLLHGESGTGKEVAAQAYHSLSRRSGAFVPVNCAAIPSSLAEAQLFGVARGAFTGALEQPGLLGSADSGTLFLDEIGELPLEIQPKLLRVLENHTFMPVGSQRTITSTARIIAATNRDLPAAMQKKSFREDLYARLSAELIEIPPLRQRREDILLLAQRFEGSDFKPSPRLVSALLNYDWPLNVRELKNLVGRLRDRSEEEVLAALPRTETCSALPGLTPKPLRAHSDTAIPAPAQIAALLKEYHGNLSHIEAKHGYSRRQFRRWAQSCGFDVAGYRKQNS